MVPTATANEGVPPWNGDDEVPEIRPVDDNNEIFGLPPQEDFGFRLDSDQRSDLESSSAVTWKELTNVLETKATIGLAMDTAWEQAQCEFEFIRAKIKDKCGTERPKLDAIVDLIFGPDSVVYKAFEEEGIFDDHKLFLQFLATFFMYVLLTPDVCQAIV